MRRFASPGAVNGPVITGGALYAATPTGRLVAFRRP
jgi:hypothetical protein